MATILPKYLRKYIASDYAVTEPSEGVDPNWTVHVVIGLSPDDRAFILDVWRGRELADVWINELFRLVKKHKPECCFGEAGVIANSTKPLLKRMIMEQRVYFRQEWIASTTNKAARARSLQAWASTGRVLFPRTEIADICVEELVGFLAGAKHDDVVDALSLFFLAIDTAHPAIVPSAEEEEPEGKWRRRKSPKLGWKSI
jgi:predicted phage terminase large subunit-like protein